MSESAPRCIGIILDGNRRWAKERNLPSLEGHRRGFENLQRAAGWVRDRHVPHLIVYAFSTENWNRSSDEVSNLMDIFRETIQACAGKMKEEGVQVRFVGQRERFPEDMQQAMRTVEDLTVPDAVLTLWICLSYGARAEIVAAATAAAQAGLITEKRVAQHLWTAGMPDPDIIIRTGGEQRLSNFLLWQSAYSELFFIKPYWPDFDENILDSILVEFAARERRMGK